MVLGVSGQRPDGCLRVSSDHVIMFKSMFFLCKIGQKFIQLSKL